MGNTWNKLRWLAQNISELRTLVCACALKGTEIEGDYYYYYYYYFCLIGSLCSAVAGNFTCRPGGHALCNASRHNSKIDFDTSLNCIAFSIFIDANVTGTFNSVVNMRQCNRYV